MRDEEKISVLMVDDERAALFGLRKALARQGYRLLEANNGSAAFIVASEELPDIVLSDIVMPGMGGIELLTRLREIKPEPIVILITAFGSERVAIEATKAGAYDYISKPYDIDELRLVVRNAAEKVQLRRENELLKEELTSVSGYKGMIGQSFGMRAVFELIDKVSSVDITVLIRGQSGTGKELVARAIHSGSPRADANFVPMNCAAIPKQLMESELFGHEKGAFTGAASQRIGKFELADKGTLFLDEIGDMSLETQAKILRVIQEGVFERLGSSKSLKSDVRIVSATNKNLESGIEEGWFREDLYYRMKVVEIHIPDLRDRKEDIPLLIDHFISRFNSKHGRKVESIEPRALNQLVSCEWQGNVRQLMNTVEQAVALSEGTVLKMEDFSTLKMDSGKDYKIPRELHELPFREAKQKHVESFERDYIVEALKDNKGNISRTAEMIGLKRQYLQEKLKRLDIKASIYKS